MRRILLGSLVFSLLFAWSGALGAEDALRMGDQLYQQGRLESYRKSIDHYLKALASNKDSYEINWKLARSYRWYGEEAKRQNLKDWKGTCAEYGKKGMAYAERAIKLNPGSVEGHYYFALSVGIYSDGVSILTALREGLKGKSQSSFEKAYEIDKTYNRSGPTIALGRFWFVLPWPMNDKKKALKFLREAQKTAPGSIEGQLYLAEVLLDRGKKPDKTEAKALLQKVVQCPIPYFRNWAQRLLKENF